MLGHLFGLPKNLVARVVFDQSAYVKEAIKTLLHEGLIGLLLTSLMILIFLASLRATIAVFSVDSAFRAGHLHYPLPVWAARSIPWSWADWLWRSRALSIIR